MRLLYIGFHQNRGTAKKEKDENAAEKTGEEIGKDIKKGAKASNDFGNGPKKAKEEIVRINN